MSQMKDRIFKSLGTGLAIDLVPYLQTKLTERNDIRLYVGTDSQNSGGKTIYALVVVLHYGNNGCHVVYNKLNVPRIKDRYSRLWKEVEESVSLAQHLVDSGLPKPAFVDLDLNPNPKYRSNDILKSAMGYVESYGFNPRSKPGAIAASYCADKLCK